MKIRTTKDIVDKYYFNEDGKSFDLTIKWINYDELMNYITNDLNDFINRLKDSSMPEICQANVSGMIISLQALKDKLMDISGDKNDK